MKTEVYVKNCEKDGKTPSVHQNQKQFFPGEKGEHEPPFENYKIQTAEEL